MSPKDIDLSVIVNGWQALVAVVIVLAFVLVPAYFAWLGTRNLRREMKPNHGSSMKDAQNRQEAALGRIEATQKEQGDAIASLVDRVVDLEDEATDPEDQS